MAVAARRAALDSKLFIAGAGSRPRSVEVYTLFQNKLFALALSRASNVRLRLSGGRQSGGRRSNFKRQPLGDKEALRMAQSLVKLL